VRVRRRVVKDENGKEESGSGVVWGGEMVHAIEGKRLKIGVRERVVVVWCGGG
jgi:hypothetical protein